METKRSTTSEEPTSRRANPASALQIDLLQMYEEASRTWLARAQSEATLWSDLATKLASTRSLPEALDAYTKCVSQQMQMSAEDGRHLIEDCQQVTEKVTKSFSAGWPTGGGT